MEVVVASVGPGSGFQVSGFGFRISSFGFRVSGFGFRGEASSLGFRGEVSGSRVDASPRKWCSQTAWCIMYGVEWRV